MSLHAIPGGKAPLDPWSAWLAELDNLMIRELDMSIQDWMTGPNLWARDLRACFERGESPQSLFARIAKLCRSTAV